MKFALLQLSDIHLVDKPAANPSLLRGEAVASAVASVCPGVRHGVIVVSGDTAFSGKKAEYQHGQRLIESIRTRVNSSLSAAPVPVFTIPGNHDCDFSLATSVRETLLDPIKPERIDNDYIAQCTSVQAHYFRFNDSFDTPAASTVTASVDRIYRQRSIELSGKRVVFHLFNSAWG